MNKFLAVGLGVVAVVLVGYIGVQLLSDPPPDAAEPSPSLLADLPEGQFVFSEEVGITVTIPAAGWSWVADNAVLVKNGNGYPPDGEYMIGAWPGVLYIPTDPCQWESTMPDTPATTVDEIVAAFASQALADPSEPVDITVDGHAGRTITFHIPNDIALTSEGFTDCDQDEFCNFSEDPANGCYRHHQGLGQRDEMWIVDVDGQIWLVIGSYYPETPPEDVDELHVILGSMTFE